MKIVVFFASIAVAFTQNFPYSWSQSYCTYDHGDAIPCGNFSFGFGIDNYCIYFGSSPDTAAYDERRFDIWARTGIFKNADLEIKYSYPTAGVISFKYKFYDRAFIASIKPAFGYMKGTRIGYITDYVYDFYATLMLGKRIMRDLKLVYCPKLIFSLHARDRQEHSDRTARHILQYGHCFELAIGTRHAIMPEVNWLFGDNEGTKYIVNQFGVGVNVQID